MTQRDTLEETAGRGERLHSEIAHRIAPGDPWRVVAIDIATGDFSVAVDVLSAADELRKRRPDAEIYFRRVGFPYLNRHPGRRAAGRVLL